MVTRGGRWGEGEVDESREILKKTTKKTEPAHTEISWQSSILGIYVLLRG